VRQSGNLLADLAQAIAFSLIAVGYGFTTVRFCAPMAGGQRSAAQRLSTLRVAVMDAGDGSLGRVLLDELQRELPGVNWQPLGLTAEASAALGTNVASADIPAVLAASDLIVGRGLWPSQAQSTRVSTEIAHAVVASPATRCSSRPLLRAGIGSAWRPENQRCRPPRRACGEASGLRQEVKPGQG